MLAPLTLVDVPPLLDYPNHRARAVVLASGASDPILSRLYAPRWAIIPNLGTDLMLPPLPHVLPVAYSRSLFRTASAWPLASALIAYNATLLLGFLNFVAAIGMALLLAAAWITWRDRYPYRTIALAVIGSIVVFFCHLMGLFFFYLLIAGYELEQLWTNPHTVLGRCCGMLPTVAVPACLYLASRLAPVADAIEFVSPTDKVRELVLPFANYSLPLDIATACAVAAFLIAVLIYGRCHIGLAAGVTLLLTVPLFVAAPWGIKGTFFVDTRFVIMLAFLLFGAVLPTDFPRIAIAAFATLFVLRMTIVGFAWHEHGRDLADLRAVTASVQPCSRVLLGEVTQNDATRVSHAVPQPAAFIRL